MRYSVLFQILVVGLSLICELGNTMGGRLLFASAPEASSAAALSPFTLVNDPVSASNLSAGSGNSADKHGDFSINRAVLLTIVVPVFAALVMVCSVCFWFMRRSHASARSSNKTSKQRPDSGTCDSYNVIPLMPFLNNLNPRAAKKKGCVTVIEYSVLQEATNNFSSENILGEGGFGRVYRAQFDDDNFAAVKKLDEDSKHAEHEFENEMDLMSKTRHPNLVSLLGYCNYENSRFLVYELMQNGSLDDQLHGPSHGSALTWSLRMKIALDSARGLEHLHEHCNPAVIHRDFKSSNILLDASFNAKLADFGLAVKVAGFGVSKDAELSGTLGYVAPEYLLDGKLTEKSDVYAFGVVLLELLFGRKPVDKTLSTECQSLVSWAMPKLTDRARLPSIIDPMIKDTMNVKHLYQLAAIAVLCIQPEPSYRPLIADVVHSLVPLVPAELGGTLRCPSSVSSLSDKSLPASYCSSRAA